MQTVELDGLLQEYESFQPLPEPVRHEAPHDPGSLTDEQFMTVYVPLWKLLRIICSWQKLHAELYHSAF